jgi:hypothetical protein
MSLLSFFQWCEATRLGLTIRESTVLFPVIESVHLVALALIGGAIIVVDLRFLGYGLTNLSLKQVARNARPWLIGGVTVMFLTGIPLFLSEATKCYFNPAFWVKMTALAAALLFAFTVRSRMAAADRAGSGSLKLTGLLSLCLWLTVGVAGRVIGFY